MLAIYGDLEAERFSEGKRGKRVDSQGRSTSNEQTSKRATEQTRKPVNEQTRVSSRASERVNEYSSRGIIRVTSKRLIPKGEYASVRIYGYTGILQGGIYE
jgi:hypothetical protein